jgi:hypothetical protein
VSGVADVRGFYAALGIELPAWAQRNATVRCFSNPDAHAREDRSPSCSVSLEHGAWRCWGCGTQGGAYDAALARGLTPAAAVELKRRHGLAADDPIGRSTARIATTWVLGPNRGSPSLAVGEDEVAGWHARLFSPAARRTLWSVARERRWQPAVMRRLSLGYDGARITIPVRDENGSVQGVLRYLPGGSPKMLAAQGTQLGLIPHPALERSERVMLVEGPPDMIAARSRGWPAIAVPGDHAWREAWAVLLRGRAVTVVMDSDPAGRAAAQRIASDLRPVAAVRVIDLAPARTDGYDLTDWLASRPPPTRRTGCAASWSSKPTITR